MIVKTKLYHWLFSLLIAIAFLISPAVAYGQTNPQWLYTALGDSLAAGTGATQRYGYVQRYRDYIQTDTGVRVTLGNIGVPGAKSADLLNALKNHPGIRNSISYSQIVTWNIGGNDLSSARDQYKARTCGGTDNQDCLRNAVALFKANWSGIIQEILSLRSTSNTIIRTMDLYNPYANRDKVADTWPNDAGNDFVVLKPYLDDANQYIAASATSSNIPYAKVYLAFNGPSGDIDPSTFGYISADGYHPNDAGHQKIADLLRSLGYSPLK